MTGITRRALLRSLSLPAGMLVSSTSARENRARSSRSGFDPTVHGFGFDNYSTPLEPDDPDEVVSEGEVREYVATALSRALGNRSSLTPDDVPDMLVRAVAGQLYVGANRLFGTKGYCFGLVAAAQWYFEEPASTPVDADVASQITHVDDPLADRNRTPVRDDIERFHRSQFLDPDSWMGRRALLQPGEIDYRSQARAIRDEIDAFGSTGVTITGKNVLNGHYVLLYEYRVNATDVTFTVYDPNYSATQYAATDERPVIGVDTATYEPLMGSYDDEYDWFLHNRHDREIRTQARPDR